MTKPLYKTQFSKVNHSTFGGMIYHSDFNTEHRGKDNPHGSAIARRIAYDNKFDEQCRNNIASRQNYERNKNAQKNNRNKYGKQSD